MTTKQDIQEIVNAKLGKNFAYNGAAVDSIWYSIIISRPIEDAARGLANAIAVGTNAPTEYQLSEARRIIEDLYPRTIEGMSDYSRQ